MVLALSVAGCGGKSSRPDTGVYEAPPLDSGTNDD